MYILVNIGCIECGVSSNIVGLFTSKIQAEGLAESLSHTHNWREGGQNSFEIFELPQPDVINPEYATKSMMG